MQMKNMIDNFSKINAWANMQAKMEAIDNKYIWFIATCGLFFGVATKKTRMTYWRLGILKNSED